MRDLSAKLSQHNEHTNRPYSLIEQLVTVEIHDEYHNYLLTEYVMKVQIKMITNAIITTTRHKSSVSKLQKKMLIILLCFMFPIQIAIN